LLTDRQTNNDNYISSLSDVTATNITTTYRLFYQRAFSSWHHELLSNGLAFPKTESLDITGADFYMPNAHPVTQRSPKAESYQ